MPNELPAPLRVVICKQAIRGVAVKSAPIELKYYYANTKLIESRQGRAGTGTAECEHAGTAARLCSCNLIWSGAGRGRGDR